MMMAVSDSQSMGEAEERKRGQILEPCVDIVSRNSMQSGWRPAV